MDGSNYVCFITWPDYALKFTLKAFSCPLLGRRLIRVSRPLGYNIKVLPCIHDLRLSTVA